MSRHRFTWSDTLAVLACISALVFMTSVYCCPASAASDGYSRGDWMPSGWEDADRDCQDTRAEVLIAESTEPAMLDPTGCRVASGVWIDPYTGQRFTDPAKLDIDHLVPLHEAYLSGGWLWNEYRRRAFANELSEPWHLVAVSASANRSKGDKAVPDWLPPNRAAECDYLRAWLRVKTQWDLRLRPAEARYVYERLPACLAPSWFESWLYRWRSIP